MTDNEIIKALECCGNIVDSTCKKCVYHETYNASCVVRLMRDALDLINRQQKKLRSLKTSNTLQRRLLKKQEKEIERLTIEKDNLIRNYRQCMTEAIKEFAGRLKEKTTYITSHLGNISVLALHKLIYNLVKEMTEVKNNE